MWMRTVLFASSLPVPCSFPLTGHHPLNLLSLPPPVLLPLPHQSCPVLTTPPSGSLMLLLAVMVDFETTGPLSPRVCDLLAFFSPCILYFVPRYFLQASLARTSMHTCDATYSIAKDWQACA